MGIVSIDVGEQNQGLSPRQEAMVSWGTSSLLHAGVALLLVAALFAINKKKSTAGGEIEVIPTAGKAADIEKKTGSGIPVSLDLTPQQAIQNLIKNVPDPGLDLRGKVDGTPDQMSGIKGIESPDYISLGLKGGNPKGAAGSPWGGSGVGKLAGYGPTDLFAGGPRGKGGPGIGGENGRVAKVVFVLDHSGSMIDTFDFLREEVKRVVKGFSPAQQFAVVMFDEDVQVLGPNQLQRALPSVKRELFDQLDHVRAAGRNDDLLDPFTKALGRAFAMKPQTIVFLTDGKFDEKLPSEVQRMNADGKVKINTIAFVNISKISEAQLQEIAKDNGGKYRFVSENDLGK